MTSQMTSERDRKTSLLYSCLTEISTFLLITHERIHITWLNFTQRCTMALYKSFLFCKVEVQLTRSPGQKVVQIFKWP